MLHTSSSEKERPEASPEDHHGRGRTGHLTTSVSQKISETVRGSNEGSKRVGLRKNANIAEYYLTSRQHPGWSDQQRAVIQKENGRGVRWKPRLKIDNRDVSQKRPSFVCTSRLHPRAPATDEQRHMYVCMYSYTDAGGAHAELLLVTCLIRKTLRGIKTSSHQCVFCKAPCCLYYLTQKPMSVWYRGGGERRAIEHVSGPPELSQDPSLHHPFGGFS